MHSYHVRSCWVVLERLMHSYHVRSWLGGVGRGICTATMCVAGWVVLERLMHSYHVCSWLGGVGDAYAQLPCA